MRPEERVLDGGLILREATPDDVEAILASQVRVFGATEEIGIRSFLTGPGAVISDWSVVLDGERVVSSCTLLPQRVLLDEAAFAAGEIEFVATEAEHQRRGLVRAQFDWHHERSEARGHLAQFVGGIPYVYRRFGYGYGVSYADLFTFDQQRLRVSSDRATEVTFRAATDADLPALVGLERLRTESGVRFARDEVHWRRWMDMAAGGTVDGEQRGTERFWLAERAGEPVGWVSISVEDSTGHLLLMPCLAVDDAVADAIIAHALDQAGSAHTVIGHDTPGSIFGRRVRSVGTASPYGLGIYVRIADPAAFLGGIRPVLSRRLAASSFAEASGRLDISLYATGVALEYEAGVITAVRSIPGVEDPFDRHECGVAPDWFPALAFGRFGAKGLDERVDDVSLGKDADLLEVLFPRLEADIVGDF